MGRDEVDRRERQPAVVGVEVARAREARGEVADAAGVAAPEVADGVAVLVVPLAPQRREPADQVALAGGVPGLGDQLHLAEHRVLVDRGQERRVQVDVRRRCGASPGPGRTGSRRRASR